MTAGAAALSVATSSASPGLRAALEMPVAVRVAGAGPPRRCPVVTARAVTVMMASVTRIPAPITTSQMSISASTSKHDQQHARHPAQPRLEPRRASAREVPRQHSDEERQELRREHLPADDPRVDASRCPRNTR